MSDDQLQALMLIDELIERMVARGVRRASVRGRFGESVELELDPAAQILPPRDGGEPEPKREKPPGECSVAACEKKGGWMRTDLCRDHFHSQLRSPRRNR